MVAIRCPSSWRPAEDAPKPSGRRPVPANAPPPRPWQRAAGAASRRAVPPPSRRRGAADPAPDLLDPLPERRPAQSRRIRGKPPAPARRQWCRGSDRARPGARLPRPASRRRAAGGAAPRPERPSPALPRNPQARHRAFACLARSRCAPARSAACSAPGCISMPSTRTISFPTAWRPCGSGAASAGRWWSRRAARTSACFRASASRAG